MMADRAARSWGMKSIDSHESPESDSAYVPGALITLIKQRLGLKQLSRKRPVHRCYFG